MRKNEDRSFQTSDLPLAVSLLVLGFDLDGLDASNPSRVVFRFSQQDSLSEAVDAFWKGELSLEPKAFWNVQRELKARIRNTGGFGEKL